ncbi:hypothetical protein [Streptomyces synnematoformans]|uniref:Uncharacterized protein n=1 Tax=Streptomyces synnematoformans TaxID=415721 RepID=A0ABN2YJS2_9ACTN
MKRRFRIVPGTVLALVLGLGAALLGTAGPAAAALRGTVTAAPSSGDLTTKPMVDQLTVDGACPAAYADKAHVLVLRPDFTVAGALATQVADGAPYAQAPFTIDMPETARSLGDVLGTDPADGVYQIDIRCLNSGGTYVPGNNFLLPITVTGGTWEAGAPNAVETTLDVSAEPAGQTVVNTPYKLTATVTPADATGVVEFTDLGSYRTTRVEVRNGVAELAATAGSAVREIPYTATFLPADGAEFRSSSTALGYFSVLKPAIQVLSEDGDVIEEGAKLRRGQRVQVTAEGFRPGEAVDVTIPRARGKFADATADDRGVVTGYELTVPKHLWYGRHALTLTGADSGVEVAFAFRVSWWW